MMKIRSVTEIDRIAKTILSKFPLIRFFAVYGQLGAGKTTLIKAMCKILDVKDAAISPTFTIINEYITGNNDPVYHFDMYRITKPEELFDIGYEEYFYSNHYCFVEWPEIIEDLLPEISLRIYITVNKDNSRTIAISESDILTS